MSAATEPQAHDRTAAPYTLRQAMTAWFTARLRRRLALALTLALGLPWLIGEFAKQFVQPGLHNDALRARQLIDYMVLGGMAFGLTMVATWLVGVWVTAVMKGPALLGDAFPDAEAGNPSAKDSPPHD